MKRTVSLFLVILLTRIICFSSTISEATKQDSIVSITSDQLKYTNLIFVEHKKLLEENKLLSQKIEDYQVKVDYLQQTDSLRVAQMYNYQIINKAYVEQIEGLNKTIRRKNRTITYWKIGGVTVTVGLLLFLLLR